MKPKEFVMILGGIGVFAAFVSSCATRETTGSDPRHSVIGHVRLIGYRTAESGAFLGTEVVDDADGIVVELLRANQVVATTSRHAGKPSPATSSE